MIPRKRQYNAKLRSKLSRDADGKISRKSIEVTRDLYLKSDPEIVDAIGRLIEEHGYTNVPEAIRHLLYVGIAATPVDGEFKAAIRSVKTQMVQYFTIGYWGMLKELVARYENDFSKMNAQDVIDAEIKKNREKDGRPPDA